MSDILLSLLLITCGAFLLNGANGIQNAYQHKKDSQWRFLNKRQDLYTHPRLLLWKPAVPQQKYVSPKTLVVAPMPISYNYYGYPHMAAPPVHHQSYMFAVPTSKPNTYPYQSVKETTNKRSPAFHHVTIINAVIPKPYFPPPTPPIQHLQKSYRKYRSNKQLYLPYFNTQRPGSVWQNGNISRNPIVPHKQNQVVHYLPIHGNQSTSVAFPYIEDKNKSNKFVKQQNQETIVMEKKINMFQCGIKSDDLMSTNSNNLHHLCPIFADIQNETKQEDDQPPPQTKQHASITLTTLQPSTQNSTEITNVKLLRSHTEAHISQKPIFLPTPINIVPVHTTVTPVQNFATFLPLKQNMVTNSNFRSPRNDVQQNFFTIEDAITKKPPVSHIFNDPYEAYRHARNRQQHYHKPQNSINTPSSTTTNSLFETFFDDVYDKSEAQHVDDYPIIENYEESITPMSYISYGKNYRRPNRTKNIRSNSIFNSTIHTKMFHNSHQYTYKPKNNDQHITTTRTPKTTTTLPSSPPNIFDIFSPKLITTAETKLTTAIDVETTTYTSGEEMQKVDTTTFMSLEKPTTSTTAPSTSTATENSRLKKVIFKRPFHPIPTSMQKYKKPVRNLFKSNKNVTTTPFTTKSVAKKSHKYQRQYKTKKNKHIKHELSTLPSVSSTRSLPPTTPASIVEANIHNRKYQEVTSEVSKSKRILKSRPLNSERVQPNKKSDSPTPTTKTRNRNNKRRRNNQTTGAVKTTPTTSLFPQTSTTSKTRVTNESRKNPNKIVGSNEISDLSLSINGPMLAPTKDEGVPPLPIEIYFKKSQNAKI